MRSRDRKIKEFFDLTISRSHDLTNMSLSIPNNFLGLPEEFSNYENAKVAVLPVPYEATVSYGRGTANGPDAIIEASKQVELYDEEIGRESHTIGIATLDALNVKNVPPSKVSEIISPAVSKIIHDKKMPVVLGGEHSITPGIIEAVCKAHPDITVVQFDAHADLREQYEGERSSHACAMARVKEFCPVVHVGIRNLSEDEAKWAEREKLPIYYAYKLQNSNHWMNDALADIKTSKVYITFDVDAFDSGIMPATGTPEPGGLTWYQVTEFIKMLSKHKKIIGMDFVELAPIAGFHACDFLVAKLIYKSIGYLSLSFPRV